MPSPVDQPSVSGRRERKKADKRARILRAATELFNERGFAAATTSAIAEAAGIGTGTLFLYFPTKEDLLVAVFREEICRAWEDAFASIDPDLPLLDQLLGAFGAVVEYHERDPELARAFVKELLFVSEESWSQVHEVMQAFYDGLEHLLRSAQARDKLTDAVPARALGVNLFNLYFALIQRRFAGHLEPGQLRERLETAFRIQLLGLTPAIP